MNRSNVNSNSNIYKNSSKNTQKLIISAGSALFILLVSIILIYIAYYTYVYYSVPCNNKIPYFHYLTNFGASAFCIPDEIRPINLDSTTVYEEGIGLEGEDSPSSPSSLGDQVFQISNQTFGWEEAKCKCESYGARLATKAELTDAYNKGAHWCSYGWIENGEAYYPVQQCELDRKAQNIREYEEMLKNHYKEPRKYTWEMVNEARNKMERENSMDFCGGAAGLHGGKFENRNIKFGATCFGKKPPGMAVREKVAKCEKSDAEKARETESKKQAEEQKKCDGKSPSDVIAAFNPDKW